MLYYIQYNIGKCKYCVSSYDGIATHKDGSPFYGINIFSNKKKMNAYVKELISQGYKERSNIL